MITLNGICDADGSHVVKGSTLNPGETWYLDNGSSRHLTGYKSLLMYFAEKDGLVVTFGDNNGRAMTGVGAFECRENDIYMV
uniref:Retrovirus-related Pol polyprotein from transposon TNT 1-94-like beta-barrel domain-containing protein n=1 Tax=Lactuca sativa TaxID=4236 RepID=A0A9R1XES0_LACSA|nr:hypothetical protein LSAT_V11C400218290 [Lactuca sativa]